MTSIQVHPLEAFKPLESEHSTAHLLQADLLASNFSAKQLPPAISASTYLWTTEGGLEPELWSFETFLKKKLHLWVSSKGDGEWIVYDEGTNTSDGEIFT